MTHGRPQNLRHAKRDRYARMGHQIRMRRLAKRVVELHIDESVVSLFRHAARRMDLLTQAFQRTREATEILIAAMKKGAA